MHFECQEAAITMATVNSVTPLLFSTMGGGLDYCACVHNHFTVERTISEGAEWYLLATKVPIIE
jgi:hypothetical protein